MALPELAATPTLVGIPMAMTLGLAFGMGPCLLACLPYLGPVFLNSDGGVRQSWHILLPLSLGRLTAYGGFGFLAGLAGQLVSEVGDSPVRLVLGCATLMVGGALLLRGRRSTACAAHASAGQATISFTPLAAAPRSLMPGGLYLMGIGMALTPCAPLGMVLISAAVAGSGLHGLALGLGFGAGAIFVPSLAYGIGAAYFGSRLREQLGPWRHRIEFASAALLMLSGATQLLRLV